MDESKIIERILECSYDAQSANFVKAVVDQLKEAESPSFNRADLIVEAKLGILYADQIKQIQYLHGCFLRCEDFARKDKLQQELKDKIPDLMRLLARYANLVLTMPEMFSDPDGNMNMSTVAGADLLVQLFCPTPLTPGGPVPNRILTLNFVHLLVTTICDELDPADDQLTAIQILFQPALDQLMQRIKGRCFTDHKMQDVGFLTSLISRKSQLLNKIVTTCSKQFQPDAQKIMFGTKAGQEKSNGFNLQMESLFGTLLCPTTMDTMLYRSVKADVRSMHFENATKKSQKTVEASKKTLQGTMGQVMEQTLNVVNPLLRSGEDCREAVVHWLAEMLKGNDDRAKGANQIHEGGQENHFIDTLSNSDIPFHQNLDARLTMQIQQARTVGYSTPGCGLNVFWLLLELNRPVKISAVGQLLDSSIFAVDEEVKKLLGDFSSETKMGDEEQVKLAKSGLKMALLDENGNQKQKFKFATQIFTLLLKSFNCLACPVLKEDMCYVAAFSSLWNKAPEKADKCFGEHLCISTVLEQEGFLSGLIHGINLLALYLLAAAYPECKPKFADNPDRPAAAFTNVTIPPKQVSPEWSVLPACLVENLVAILEYFRDVQYPPTTQHPFYQRVDVDSLLLLLVFFLGAGDHVKNPSTRGKVVNIISFLIKSQRWATRLQEFKPVVQNIIPSCLLVFNAVEKTKQSYYDIRMQLKYQLRVPIMELFGLLISGNQSSELHRKNLRNFASEQEDDFLKFLNLLMSDATVQLDEGMDTLASIRKRKVLAERRARGEQINDEELMETAAAGVGVDRGGMEDDERNEQGEDLYRRSRRDPKEHCVTYMKLGFRTIKTLHSIVKETPEIVTKKSVVLQQMVQNCLNACMDRLVGPKSMNLKQQGGQKDYAEFHFKPVELLTFIIEMLVVIARTERDKVIHHVINDARAGNINTFEKAVRISRRDGMISKDLSEEFASFVKALLEQTGSAEDQLAAIEQKVGSLPEEYMDPLMDIVMNDPVELPSGNIVNRDTAERIAMGDGMDPFTKASFTKKDLKPAHELRKKIYQFFTVEHGYKMAPPEVTEDGDVNMDGTTPR
ncbi:unnamed protein product [Amoebophrya sp. A120]|nr:unnamed protein product [Amoebophrya sp. A120]|eukprot:GSA120T00007367001.1